MLHTGSLRITTSPEYTNSTHVSLHPLGAGLRRQPRVAVPPPSGYIKPVLESPRASHRRRQPGNSHIEQRLQWRGHTLRAAERCAFVPHRRTPELPQQHTDRGRPVVLLCIPRGTDASHAVLGPRGARRRSRGRLDSTRVMVSQPPLSSVLGQGTFVRLTTRSPIGPTSATAPTMHTATWHHTTTTSLRFCHTTGKTNC